MYTDEQLLDFYATAYFNETGLSLTQNAINKIEFDGYIVHYDSFNETLTIDLLEFDDNDSFPYPDLVVLINEKNKGWKLAH